MHTRPVTDDPIQTELTRGSHISIIALMNLLFEHAYRAHASDIHIDPALHDIRIRLRIDGVMHDAYIFPKHIHTEIISRVKILSRLRTDEHQVAQDGRFRYTSPADQSSVDMRVSIIPTHHGENAVLRLLANNAGHFTLHSLGFSQDDQKKIRLALSRQSGMILISGPTGSGKTSTLYTFLHTIHSPEISIVTIEDPIEYALSGITQIQTNTHTGLTFANGLRSILRQDPNVIMVGEIRDKETAHIAVNTALTGHLLLSTIHTTDTVSVIPRLLDMGIDAYLIAATLSLIVAQRLVRTSYGGRISINEILVITDELRELILRKASNAELSAYARRNGMKTMLEDGLEKVQRGLTTIEDITLVMHE